MRTPIFSLCIASLVMVFCGSGEAADKSLVLGFSFDEGQGRVVKDSSPAQNNGMIEDNLKWVAGKLGGAMRFDAGGFIEVPHSESLNLPEAHTISYWLKWDGQGANWSPFISKAVGEAAGRRSRNNFTTWVGKDKIWNYDNIPHGLLGEALAKGRIPLGNKWIHLTVIHDGKETVSFYINGAFNSAAKLKVGFVNEINLRVGDDGKDNRGAGIIDELAIFNRALTEGEIKEFMRGGIEGLAVEPTDKLTTTWGHIRKTFLTVHR